MRAFGKVMERALLVLFLLPAAMRAIRARAWGL
jgi:hypothetical protein